MSMLKIYTAGETDADIVMVTTDAARAAFARAATALRDEGRGGP